MTYSSVICSGLSRDWILDGCATNEFLFCARIDYDKWCKGFGEKNKTLHPEHNKKSFYNLSILKSPPCVAPTLQVTKNSDFLLLITFGFYLRSEKWTEEGVGMRSRRSMRKIKEHCFTWMRQTLVHTRLLYYYTSV